MALWRTELSIWSGLAGGWLWNGLDWKMVRGELVAEGDDGAVSTGSIFVSTGPSAPRGLCIGLCLGSSLRILSHFLGRQRGVVGRRRGGVGGRRC